MMKTYVQLFRRWFFSVVYVRCDCAVNRRYQYYEFLSRDVSLYVEFILGSSNLGGISNFFSLLIDNVLLLLWVLFMCRRFSLSVLRVCVSRW